MRLNKIIFIILFFLLSFANKTLSKENKILVKVNNDIITSIDILNEIKYLSAINEDFKNTENNLKVQIAKKSLIREKIKNIELLKYNQNIQIDDALLENIVKSYFAISDISSIAELELFFEQRGLKAYIVKKKIITEIMWNRLIYTKFKEKVKIDENQIKESFSNKKKQKEYLLSEILVNADDNKQFKKKLELINTTIKEKNFSQAALTYSVSETSRNGGKLGWIKENILNDKIKKQLNVTGIGDFTNPITIAGGFLILKIEDVREVENKIDLNKEIQNIIEKKTNEQLNRYSNIYFNKIKKNIQINEI